MSANRTTVHARRSLANNVAQAFLPLEASADATSALALRCTATLLEIRRDAGLGVTEGEDVLRMIHDGCRLAFEAQALFRRAHAELVPLAEKLSVTGYAPECPGIVAGLSPDLKAVA